MLKQVSLLIALTITFSATPASSSGYAYVIANKLEKNDTIKHQSVGLGKYIDFFNHLIKKKGKPRKIKKHPPTFNSSRFQDLKEAKKFAYFQEKDWDSVQGIKTLKYKSINDTTHKRIFGFHPYWMGTAYKNYNFDLLTDIAYFSFELDPESGKLKQTESWTKTALIDSARAHHSNLYFTITNFTSSNNTTFLKNEKAKRNAEEEILKILKKQELKGVVLDFEDVPKEQKDNLQDFIKQLSQRLQIERKTVCLTLPAINNGVYNVNFLEKYISYFLLMGYDYFGSWSETAGPVAPIASENTWGSYNVQKSVSYYLEKGLSRNQLILTVPYYGSQWQTTSPSLPAKATSFDSHLTYRQIKEQLPQKISYDKLSKSAYYNYVMDGNNQQIWFEDSTSLAKKYNLINRENLAGVGIWALGYDNGYTELWALLDKKFGSKDGTIPKDLKIPERQRTSPIDLASQENIFTGNYRFLKAILLIVVFALVLASLISLRRQRVRNVLLQYKYSSFVVLVILTITGCWLGIHFKYLLYTLVGILGLLIGIALQVIYKSTNFKKSSKHILP